MSLGGQVGRMRRYVQEHGVLGFARRSAELAWRATVGNKVALFCLDVSDADRRLPASADGRTVERVARRDRLAERDRDTLAAERGKYRGSAAIESYLRDRFAKRAELWLLRIDGELAGFQWTTRGAMVSPFYVPLLPNDGIVFDVETFPRFRGKGCAGFLLDHAVASLAAEGVNRFYVTIKLWNESSLRWLAKSRFVRCATARKFTFLGRRFTVWY
jgi:hypothetical protein